MEDTDKIYYTFVSMLEVFKLSGKTIQDNKVISKIARKNFQKKLGFDVPDEKLLIDKYPYFDGFIVYILKE